MNKDIETDVTNLTEEFRRIGPLIYRYSEMKAATSEEHSNAEEFLKQLKSQKFVQFKNEDSKRAEGLLKAMVESDPHVVQQSKLVNKVKYDLDTITGFLDGLKAKKDALVQLGADARKYD